MNPRQVASKSLAQAFSKRWRTAPSQASLNLTAGSFEAWSALPAVGGTRSDVGRGKLNENYAEILRNKGFQIVDPANDPETEHETWRGNGYSILIDKEGNEWHHMVNGHVKEVGSLDDDSLMQFVHESNDAQEPDRYQTSPSAANDTNEPRFLRMAKAELARRRDMRCSDCGFMGLPAGDGLCPNCGGKLQEPRSEQQQVQDFAEMRKAIIAQVRESASDAHSVAKSFGYRLDPKRGDYDMHVYRHQNGNKINVNSKGTASFYLNGSLAAMALDSSQLSSVLSKHHGQER